MRSLRSVLSREAAQEEAAKVQATMYLVPLMIERRTSTRRHRPTPMHLVCRRCSLSAFLCSASPEG